MAPSAAPSVPLDASPLPLADYFFIAGIESSSVFENRRQSNGISTTPHLESTVEEDGTHTKEVDSRPSSASKRDSKTKARFSYEKRKSIISVITPETPSSNRSSVTITPKRNGEQAALTEDTFDEAMRKFAQERDSFLDDIQFSAGQLAQPNKPRPRPKTQRITNDTKRDSVGLMRRLSTINPLSRSNTAAKRSSNRNSKRISGYNSVIPSPQRFQPNANMHPLKRPYEPGLLDQYPPKGAQDETKRRCAFPDYVPMFVFPNDVNVISSDEKPRATWHGFAMTSNDNSRVYGICLITWIPVVQEAADELERQCEIWRKKNMTDEERELANSLGERLANERAHLSQLLSELPFYDPGTVERDQKDEQISEVEERITLMTDLLRPVRHGAAAKIEGLTDSDTGLWMPRAYGVLGKDANLTTFWKEWLKAIVVPMTNGGVLGVPPSSPRTGMWQPLEQYVVNLCAEALSPTNSATQVEIALRELRLHARKEGINEIPGSRNTDLYALFRSLDIPDIIVLFEYVLAESRIILLSSHTTMLHLVSAAIAQLIYPFKWAGVFIPVLPARLIQALEAPCPYIVGIERRYENVELPEDDFVIVDLDQGMIEATQPPISLPRQQRRKLQSILQITAPHHYRYGVPIGPPKYATEAFPNDIFQSENPNVFNTHPTRSNLSHLANLNSASFGNGAISTRPPAPIINAFASSRTGSSHSNERPMTSSTSTTKVGTPPSPSTNSPQSTYFTPSMEQAVPRTNSSNQLQATLREKRSGVFEHTLRRNSSFGFDRIPPMRRPSAPLSGHGSTMSVSTMSTESSYTPSQYAPSVYAQSTLAASTIMPNVLMQPVRNTPHQQYIEAHCLQVHRPNSRVVCSICDENAEENCYKCSGCGIHAHSQCMEQISVVCPVAFFPDQIIVAFVRCFASLLYTYRKSMTTPTPQQRKSGLLYKFDFDHFQKTVPRDCADYVAMLRETQAFNEFVYERETKRSDDPSIRLFDEIILSKRNRGRAGIFSKTRSTDFLSDISDHLWQTAHASPPANRAQIPQSQVLGRVPAKLDPSLLREPRVMQGVPRLNPQALKGAAKRKPVPSMLSQG